MTKTCYFCKNYDDCEVYSDSEACDKFQPNTDWLEYESLKKENEELKKLKDITKSFAERCRIIFTQSENIPPSIRSEYLKHTQYEYDEIKRVIDGLDEVEE
jgi:hypothetical protein